MDHKVYVLSDSPAEITFTERIYHPISQNDILLRGSDPVFTGFPQWLSAFDSISAGTDLSISGLCCDHKYFIRLGNLVTESYLIKIFRDYDMVLPYTVSIKGRNLRTYYGEAAGRQDFLSRAEAVLSRDFPSCHAAFVHALEHRQLTPGGCIICRATIGRAFCSWMKEVIRALNKEASIPENGKDLLAEILLRTWLLENAFSVKEESVQAKSDEALLLPGQKADIIYNFLHSRMQQLISHRQTHGFSDTLLPEFECEDDFDGKIPVWICWWQGAEEFPPLVNICIQSIQKNIPKELAVLRIITLENCGRYVCLSEDIVRKFNEGKISYTHLSEPLRTELLYRYGGLWIDATYFISRPIPETFFRQDFFTIAFAEPLFGPDISMGRWSTSLWYARPQDPLMQFLAEEMQIYWEQEDDVIDYFTFDYEVAIAYHEFPAIKEMIDNCPKSPAAVYDLQRRLNLAATPDEVKRFEDGSLFYKINRRYEYTEKTSFGQPTLLGYIEDRMREETAFHPKDIHGLTLNCTEGRDSLISLLRETNADAILDCTGYFIRSAQVSRGILPDALMHPFRLDLLLPSPEDTLCAPADIRPISPGRLPDPVMPGTQRAQNCNGPSETYGRKILPIYSTIYDHIWPGRIPDNHPVYDVILLAPEDLEAADPRLKNALSQCRYTVIYASDS